MLVWAYHQRVSRLKNVAKKLKIRYGKNKTISVRVKGRLDPIFLTMKPFLCPNYEWVCKKSCP